MIEAPAWLVERMERLRRLPPPTPEQVAAQWEAASLQHWREHVMPKRGKQPKQAKQPKRNLRIGGVMRCCAETLDTAKDLQEVEGTILPCLYCKSSLRFKDGAWEWNRPADLDGRLGLKS